MATEYITHNGRKIEVETSPDPPTVAAKLRRRGKRRQEAFVLVPLWWAERGGLSEISVCADLLRRAWEAKGKSFPLPNRKGVNPKIKYRVLRQLESSGLIKVEWQPRKSPLITMTPPIS